MAAGDGRKGIVGIETPWNPHLCGKGKLSGNFKGDTQEARAGQMAAVRPTQLSRLPETVGLYLAGNKTENERNSEKK